MYRNLVQENSDYKMILRYLICFLLALLIRNFYNLYKKRSFRKKIKKLTADIETNKSIVNKYHEQVIQIKELDSKLVSKQKEIDHLVNEIDITIKNHEDVISTKEQEINYQKKAFEKHIDYKNIDINNTRLGAHFIKNIINQIYEDLEKKEPNYIKILGIKFKLNTSQTKFPSIKALKSIFILLDYNVAAVNQGTISIKEELKHINMFLDLIRYLKPKTKIELNNSLNTKQNNEIMIKPTLFFPFVENVLKHGSLNSDDSFINITLTKTENNQLNYSILNSAEHKLEQDLNTNASSNFGLNALEQLIKTYYPGSTLEHKSLTNDQYYSQLTINVN